MNVVLCRECKYAEYWGKYGLAVCKKRKEWVTDHSCCETGERKCEDDTETIHREV